MWIAIAALSFLACVQGILILGLAKSLKTLTTVIDQQFTAIRKLNAQLVQIRDRMK
jgi:hypothetical protein